MQVGFGYDIHKLQKGRKLIIGGVQIPHNKGLLGHTDADVLVHAIIDSLLGASGLGDIGQYFPDTDPKWKDANSMDLLEVVYISLKNKGFSIINIDTTILAEEPKLSTFTSLMKNVLSKALELKGNQINIKVKTNEGMDSVGQENAIAAWAIVLISWVN